MGTNYVLGPSAARKVKALLGGAGKVTRREGAASALAFDADYPAPFAVQWAQSVKEGKGAWIIWLPGEKLVVTAVGPLDPAKNLTAVGGDYPEGWYLLDDTMLDKDKGGTLYLCIALGKSVTATFADSPAGASTEEYDVEICTASVNSTTGERTVKQFVSSAIVLGTGDDTDTQYGADGKSISLTDAQSAGELLPHEGKHFYLNGFGRFQFDGDLQVHGSFTPAGSETVNIGDDDETEFAVLCRTGNKETPNANALAYSKLKFKASGGSSPFAYEKSTKISDLQTVTTHKLVNCGFYWNSEYKSLPDFDVSGLLGGGSVFLRGQQAEPSSASPDPAWEWSLGTSAASAPSGGKVLNYKLYDFAASKVAIDYRTSFLALEDHTPKAQVLVTKPNGNASILLDATGDQPKLVITDGTNTVSINLADVASDCSGNFGLHELSFLDENGDTQVYHGLFCSDIDLSKIKAGKTIRNVRVEPTATSTDVIFEYTDESSTYISIPNGLRGKEGKQGEPGVTPTISAIKNGEITSVFANGNLIATIDDGHTPKITATQADGVTTLFVDGDPVAQIKDGGVSEYESITCISGIRFEVSGGQLNAIISTQSFHVPSTFEMHPLEHIDVKSVKVCSVGELDVVTSESYSTSSHAFTNSRKRIKVIGSPSDAQGETPFTATPMSDEE